MRRSENSRQAIKQWVAGSELSLGPAASDFSVCGLTEDASYFSLCVHSSLMSRIWVRNRLLADDVQKTLTCGEG